MKISEPFSNKTNNIPYNNNINNYSQSNYNNSNYAMNQQNNIPPKPFYNKNKYQLNYPEKNSIEDTEFELIMHEYNSKIKPLNSSSNFISTSSEIFPSNSQISSQLNMPISISLSPLSNCSMEEYVPIIDYGSNNIPRCKNEKCSAFLNPFVKFFESGEKWLCNFCGQENDTEDHYFCDLDKNGERLDINTKTELCCGSYEFKANKSYWKKNKKPTQAFFIFLLETSLSAIDSGFLSTCIESIKDAINNDIFYNGDDTNISIITYNTNVDFYSYGDKFNQPQMLSIVDEPTFLPTSKINLVLNIEEDKEKILQILDLIQNNFSKSNVNNIVHNNCRDSDKIFAALNGAYLLGKNLGAKILIFSSSNILGDLPKMKGGLDKDATKEQIAYSCHDKKKLETMGINLTNENMSVDLFVSAEKPIKLLTLFQLCEYTNGNFYFFKKFNIDLHYKNVFNQIRRVLSRPIAWEGLNKIKFSNGLEINNYITPVLIVKNDLFVFPTLDSDQNYLFNIGYTTQKNLEENQEPKKGNNLNDFNKTKINNNNYIYIQSSLLYSVGDGHRRIRIHNLCLPLSNNPRKIYESMNGDILASYYLKLTNDKLYKNKNLANSILYIDTQFKSFIDKLLTGENRMNNELPEKLEYLPLFMIGLFKHRLFCKNEIDKNYDIDISNFLRTKLQKLSTKEIISYIYPTIYYLNDLEKNEKVGKVDEQTGIFYLPQVISCSKSAMKDDGLYLIDNGYLLILYIRKKISSVIVENLFGVNDLSFLTMIINEDNVFMEKNSFKERLMNIIDYIREEKSVFQNLIFVFEGTAGERIINETLIEDNNCQWFPMNYEKFYNKYIKQSANIPFGY